MAPVLLDLLPLEPAAAAEGAGVEAAGEAGAGEATTVLMDTASVEVSAASPRDEKREARDAAALCSLAASADGVALRRAV